MGAELRIIKPDQRDLGTAQTPGMFRAEGVGSATVQNEGLWAGHVTMSRGVRSAPHHHGESESAIYILSGRARFRYGEKLEHTAEADVGDFIFVPPYLVHQEINGSDQEPVVMIVCRSTPENIVVNLDLPNAEEG
jgi:uncharacterized RmlC-like cupin family protein